MYFKSSTTTFLCKFEPTTTVTGTMAIGK